jgi:hypothetical protein
MARARASEAIATTFLALCGCGDSAPFVGQVSRSQYWEYHDQGTGPLCDSLLSLLDEHAEIVGDRIGFAPDATKPFRYYKFSDEQAFTASTETGGEAFGDYLFSPHFFEGHEQAHLYTYRAWGGGWSTSLLNEGEAVALSCKPTREPAPGTTPRQLLGAVDWRDQLDHVSLAPDEYAAAGFFVAHLARRYGWDKVADLHRSAPPGTSVADFERAFARVFPVPVDEAWAEALDAPGASACDKTWTCRSTPLAVGEVAVPACDGQLHRSLTVADVDAGVVLAIADDRGITLSGRCAGSDAPWFPLAGTGNGSAVRHWAFVPPGSYTLFGGASDAYFPPGSPASVTDGEFATAALAPASFQLVARIPTGALSDTCGSSPPVALESGTPTYVDVVRGYVDGWIPIDGGGGSFGVALRNLQTPFGTEQPIEICDGCGPSAACAGLPADSIAIGAGAFLHLEDVWVDRPPAAGQIVFYPTLRATTGR